MKLPHALQTCSMEVSSQKLKFLFVVQTINGISYTNSQVECHGCPVKETVSSFYISVCTFGIFISAVVRVHALSMSFERPQTASLAEQCFYFFCTVKIESSKKKNAFQLQISPYSGNV